MSATGRGAVRVASDFYATPAWCVRAILPHLPVGGSILEPCAGDGAIVDVLPKRPSFTGRGTDASDYGWMVYGPGRGGRLAWLDVEGEGE